ncbi:MAG: glycosyltransferase family 4 protein [Prevotellaceae bacterium]|nr:glycosyltransferase family 4 protein [Prevotellaceae bacterium]
MKKVCMVVQDPMVKGGIAAVVNGYRGSRLEKDYNIIYVESYKDGGKLTKTFKAISGYFHFAKVLLIDKPDLIHIHSSFGPSFYRKMPFIYMASWAKKPIINHIHGADFDEFYVNANDKKKQQIKKVYGKCSVLIALSDEWKDRLSQIVPADKITVIENYSILHEDALTQRLNRASNNTVLFLGELGKRKGCYDIPAVVAEVVKQVPGVKFVLAGAGSAEDEAAIKKLCEEKGIASRVEFPGWVRGEQKDKLLREADVFFLPSYNEGMPMSVLDAMGYGLPIVSTNVGGIPKIVHDGENGYCCEPGNVDQFAASIVHILDEDTRQKEMGRQSFEIVEKKYSLEFHLRLLESVYKRYM